MITASGWCIAGKTSRRLAPARLGDENLAGDKPPELVGVALDDDGDPNHQVPPGAGFAVYGVASPGGAVDMDRGVVASNINPALTG